MVNMVLSFRYPTTLKYSTIQSNSPPNKQKSQYPTIFCTHHSIIHKHKYKLSLQFQTPTPSHHPESHHHPPSTLRQRHMSPKDPGNTLAASDKMSPNMFLPTTMATTMASRGHGSDRGPKTCQELTPSVTQGKGTP